MITFPISNFVRLKSYNFSFYEFKSPNSAGNLAPAVNLDNIHFILICKINLQKIKENMEI